MTGRVAIMDHARLCASVDVYLAVDAGHWYLVEGLELSEDDVRQLVEIPDGALESHGEFVTRFDFETVAIAAFEKRKEEG